MMMGCPMLENLKLIDVTGVRNLDFMSSNAKKLWLYYQDVDAAYLDLLKVRAPCLRELKISGTFVATQFELMDVSSLLKAKLVFESKLVIEVSEDWPMENNLELAQFNNSWIPMVAKLLNSVSHVDELINGTQQIQVLSMLKMLGRPSPVFKCKHLAIETYLWKFDLPGINASWKTQLVWRHYS